MSCKGKKREFRWALFTGLALWIGIMVGCWLFGTSDTVRSGQDELMGTLKILIDSLVPYFPVATMVVVFLWIGVLQPVMEEFAFRYWGKGKLYAYIVCAAVMANFVYLTLNIWFITLAALCIVLFFVVRDQHRKRQVSIITTSVLFASMHLSGYSSFSIASVLGILQIFGMALVMCYVVINYRFVYSIVIHVLNNSFALLLPLFFMGSEAVSGDGFTGELRPMQPQEAKDFMYETWTEDTVSRTVCYYGELPEMADVLMDETSVPSLGELRIFYADNSYLWTRYVLELHYDTGGYYGVDVVNALVKTGCLKSDTTMVPALEVSITDRHLYNSKLPDSSELFYLDTAADGTQHRESFWTLWEFLDYVSVSYNLPFVVAPNTDPSTPAYCEWEVAIHKRPSLLRMVYDPTATVDTKPTKKDVIKALRKQYGLSVKESKTKKIRQVEFYVAG
ncbi:MAG: CPBP family intramembrane metalloprotease [Bacteroidales bacterium]|nr:CPBP family intramembrane metalloprotease [Bacteroidales bacterium]